MKYHKVEKLSDLLFAVHLFPPSQKSAGSLISGMERRPFDGMHEQVHKNRMHDICNCPAPLDSEYFRSLKI